MIDTAAKPERVTRGYQQEMLDESLRSNIIIALDTGAGKTHIALLRMKIEAEREARKVSWFIAPTVTLCEQQRTVIKESLPVSVGYISGSMEPSQWKNASLWQEMLQTHRIMVSTPQVLLDALRHGYIVMGRDINLIVFDEAHHASRSHPYNMIMQEFYFHLPNRSSPDIQDASFVRPMIMGLTASPIYGGNAIIAFQTIERNLDSTIRAPIIHRDELSNFVHRPVFTHLTYADHVPGFSTNLAALEAIAKTLNIEGDPLVISLREKLKSVPSGSAEWRRLDQKLSKALSKKDTFVHKGIRDFCQSARYLLENIGTWSADWFVYTMIKAATKAANSFHMIVSSWKSSEKKYLLKVLDKVRPTQVSMSDEDILDELAPKVTTLIHSLLDQKFEEEAHNDAYSVIIFVERRDAVLALVEILKHHPFTKDTFKVGCLLGQSDTSRRHSLLDITRYISKDDQQETLRKFRVGDLNLLVCTAVAEEGIDIQACGSVIRWDPPANMASWAQSRGRARRKRSTYTLMFSAGGDGREVVQKWEQLEKEMVRLYNDTSRTSMVRAEADDDDGTEVDNMEIRVESGAALTLHSAIPHLAHFCSVIPSTVHVDTRPLYDIDPPEMPEGWHGLDPSARANQGPVGPPYGSTVTLPRCVPIEERKFSVPCIYPNKMSAHRHAAFKAYRALYDANLLNRYLLPLTSVTEPHLDDELKELLKTIEKRQGMADISLQMSPWSPADGVDGTAREANQWWCSKLTIEDLVDFFFYTRREPEEWSYDESLVLHHPTKGEIRVYLTDSQQVSEQTEPIAEAREYTRNLFWGITGTRMKWNDLDFAYLLLPCDTDSTWQERYEEVMDSECHVRMTHEDEISVRADLFGELFAYPDDISIVKKSLFNGKSYKFVRWRMQDEPLTEEEEEELRRFYRDDDLDITFPLLVVRELPKRTNFLIPVNRDWDTGEPVPHKHHLLLPDETRVLLLSPNELEAAFLLPSVLRAVNMSMLVGSFAKTNFANTPLSAIPLSSLLPAVTAPAAGERDNYQRLETLGDTVLKFTTCIQLLAEYPNWHEGYLTQKKDRIVSNGTLAKENLKRKLYRWIIRDRLISKKWKPVYESTLLIQEPPPEPKIEDEQKDRKAKKARKTQQLSTKVLADVVEAVIGAAYIHGGLDLGFECIRLFKFGMKLAPMGERIEGILGRIATLENVPLQLANVEAMIGYTFDRPLLLIEALTHGCYENELNTPSYERLEFLGDSVLDMIVTDYLYRAPGKNYSPGHIHLRRSAVVNAHLLAYICLRTSTRVEAKMPRLAQPPRSSSTRGQLGENEDEDHHSWRRTPSVELATEHQDIHLYQCLMHSSPRILEDQRNTYDHFLKWRAHIEADLLQGRIFPWASLGRLQAPKFLSDIVESILGAVFLDSRGDMSRGGAVQRVLRKLGILDVLEWIVRDDVDVLHPVSRVSQWSRKKGREVKYRMEKQKGMVVCTILLDGEEVMVRRDQVPVLNDVASGANGAGTNGGPGEEENLVVLKAVDKDRGKVSEGEVRFAVAEAAIKVFHLRDTDMDKVIMGKRMHIPKKKKDKGKEKEVSTSTHN
ncbi:hypothetical protein APHAL10511_005304 [Amanita phalloides]|nr:hypothetical protein APHAL10511_005304 [Amanita phalloides]